MHIYIRVFGTQYCHNTLYYYVFNKPITSEDTDKAHQIGTAYLVEHNWLHWIPFALMSKNKGITTEKEEMEVRLFPLERPAGQPRPGELKAWRK